MGAGVWKILRFFLDALGVYTAAAAAAVRVVEKNGFENRGVLCCCPHCRKKKTASKFACYVLHTGRIPGTYQYLHTGIPGTYQYFLTGVLGTYQYLHTGTRPSIR